MDTSRHALVGLILGGLGLLFIFLGGAPVSLVLSIVAAVLTFQGLRNGDGKVWCFASFALNALVFVISLIASLLGGLFHMIF